jgi:IS30 family transposase
MKNYTQLTREERYQIYALKTAGQSKAQIAKVIGRHKSTIGREMT